MTQIQVLSLLCITGAAALADVRTGKIPNRLLVVGVVLAWIVQVGLALPALEASPPPAVALAALKALGGATVGMLAGSLLPLALYQARALGGGDVKLLAVTGALLAAGSAIELTLTALLVAASFGVVKLIRIGRLRRALALSANRCKRLVTPGPKAPLEAGATLELRFGPAVFVAACFLAVAHWPRVEADASAPPSAPLPSALRSPAVVSP